MQSLIHLAIISVKGEQARTFLQGQISCDMDDVTETHAQLGTLCNLKGRMIASFIVCQKTEDNIYLIMHESVITSALTDLKKYAIFSRCELTVVTCTLVAQHHTHQTDWHVEQKNNDVLSIFLPNDRILQIANANDALDNQVDAMSMDEFITADIAANLPWVTDKTMDNFLPQAFFNDEFAAVSYEKGCYKGQEIVARMHFRGQMKEGLQTIENNHYQIGEELRDTDGKLQGTVIWVAPHSQKALAVMRK